MNQIVRGKLLILNIESFSYENIFALMTGDIDIAVLYSNQETV